MPFWRWYAACYACWRLGVPVVALDSMPEKALEAERHERMARELRPQLVLGAKDVPRLMAALQGQELETDRPCEPTSVPCWGGA